MQRFRCRRERGEEATCGRTTADSCLISDYKQVIDESTSLPGLIKGGVIQGVDEVEKLILSGVSGRQSRWKAQSV
jgi:hypothetical protein